MSRHAARPPLVCVTLVCVLGWALASCGGAEPEGGVSAVSPEGEPGTAAQALPLDLGAVPARPWARRACTDATEPDVLACVDGVAITRAMYDRVRAAAPADEPPRATLERLVDAEVLAAAAADAGGWRADMQPLLTRTLAQRTMIRSIEQAVTEDDVSVDDVGLAFRNAAIRSRYNRVEAFFVTDAQLLCCKGDWRQCLKREEVRRCIDENASLASGLAAALRDDPPATAAEMEARVKRLALEQFPGFSVASLTFYYDRDKPYSEQKGYDLMVEPFATAVVKMQPETIPEPVRTPYGWHIPRLNAVLPARDHKPSDPLVRADVARHILPMIRERAVMRYAGELVRSHGAKLYPERLEAAAP